MFRAPDGGGAPSDYGRDVVLISMPFNVCVMPPIGICGLKTLLDRNGFSSRIRHFNLEFLPYFSADLDIAQTLHDEISYLWDFLPGEWLFSPSAGPDADAEFLRKLEYEAHVREPIIAVLAALRRRVDDFIARCAERVTLDNPKIVGFTSSFMQNQASVALARAVKQRAPHVKIVFGGSNAFGEMGIALIEQYDEIDVVARGEAENIVAPLMRALLEGDDKTLAALPGICFRDTRVHPRAIATTPEAREQVAMDDVPIPDFADYFATVRELKRIYRGGAQLPLFLPIETSRGCWWGERSHCTFCGLNGERMHYRSREPEAAYRYIDKIRRLNGVTRLFAVDNIIDHRYYDSVLEKLAADEEDYFIHFEIKSNLKRRHVRQLERSGVRKVQPGIESLSTPILKLMRKGVTALQNIQTLKWLTEAGIQVSWYLLYGFPGEEAQAYRDMARLLPKLRHIAPPGELAPVYIERFSPYQTRPNTFGIEIIGPTQWYRMAFPEVPSDRLARMAYRFDFREPAREPDLDIFVQTALRPLVRAWKDSFERFGPTLHLIHGSRESTLIVGPLAAPERLWRINGRLRLALMNADAVTPRSALFDDCAAKYGPLMAHDDLYARFLAESPGERDPRGLDLELEEDQTLQMLEAQGLLVADSGASLALPLICSQEKLDRLLNRRARLFACA